MRFKNKYLALLAVILWPLIYFIFTGFYYESFVGFLYVFIQCFIIAITPFSKNIKVIIFTTIFFVVHFMSMALML